MAVDAALVDSVRERGTPALRFYGWVPACLSLGRNQPAAGHYDEALLADAGIEIVRRPTGGRAVLHDRELTYSVVIPDRLFDSPRTAYATINRALANGLARLGVAARSSPADGPVARPSLVPCFVEPAPGELLVDDRKIVGSAQVRIGGVILQHGSIMLGRSPALDRLPPEVVDQIAGTPAYLTDLAGREVDPDEVVDAIVAAWADDIGPVEPSVMDDDEARAARDRARGFRDPEWTWRR